MSCSVPAAGCLSSAHSSVCLETDMSGPAERMVSWDGMVCSSWHCKELDKVGEIKEDRGSGLSFGDDIHSV